MNNAESSLSKKAPLVSDLSSNETFRPTRNATSRNNAENITDKASKGSFSAKHLNDGHTDLHVNISEGALKETITTTPVPSSELDKPEENSSSSASEASDEFLPVSSPPEPLQDGDHDMFGPHLRRLESIHWEDSSRSVASVLGEMLTHVNDLSSDMEMRFDHEAPDSDLHMSLKMDIQEELAEINELFSNYAQRHPSICNDEATDRKSVV